MTRQSIIRRIVLTAYIAFTWAGMLTAQDQTVTGIVTDALGPVAGVGVVQKGTTNGIATDLDGRYSITVPQGSTLVFSSIGYVTREIPVTGGILNVVLTEDSELIEETVVIGYGVQRKSDVTGAISSVGSEDIGTRSISTVQQALQGKTAGVQIISQSAAPGAQQTVRIRGYSSNYSSDPLYVVDGLRVSSIASIDPNDIESMEVLKDAASAAIYGAEAGNGVILITTKRASSGTGTVSYDFQMTLQRLAGNPDVLNANEYITWVTEGGWHDKAYFDSFYDGVTDTDWVAETFESSVTQKHSIAFQKAGDKTNVYVSASIYDNDGIVKGDDDAYMRISSTVNVESTIKDWLRIGVNSSVGWSRTDSVMEGGFSDTGNVSSVGSIISNALYMDPLTPVTVSPDALTATMRNALDNGKVLLTDSDGNYYGLSDFSQVVNPFIYREAFKFSSKRIDLRGTWYATLSPLAGLDITSRIGVHLSGVYMHNFAGIYYAANTSEGENTQDLIHSRSSLNTYWQWENFANYTKSVGRSTFGAMAGISWSDMNRNSAGGSTNSVQKESPLFYYLDYSTADAAMQVEGTESTSRKLSWFGRLNYSYADKYIVQTSLRADAADLSVLPKDNRWGYFPAVSIGWVTSKEGWFRRSDGFSYLKVRASWGRNGSIANLSDYMWASPIASDISYPFTHDVSYSVGSLPTTLGNLNLKWETSEQTDLGIDLRFLRDRLAFSADWFSKKTKDLIVSGVTPSLTAGNEPSPINSGDINNRGFEFELSFKDQVGDFSYGVSGNIATLRNRVTYLEPTISRLPGFWANGNSYMTTFEKGYPTWYFRGYKYLGVDSATGEPLFEDVDGNGSYDEADMMEIGSGIPDVTYGITLTASWRNFDAIIFGTGTIGNDIYLYQNVNSSGRNKLRYFYDNRWTDSNPDASLPRPNSSFDNALYNSSAMVFDGSFFKIKQMQIGYSLPQKVLKAMRLSSARAYVSLDDFFTFTDYPGFDPEVAASESANTLGVDSGNYPTARKMVVGINITF